MKEDVEEIKDWKRRLSLVSRGAKYQTTVAAVLMSVLPMLAIGFVVFLTVYPTETYSPAVKMLVIVFAFALAVGGYAILYKYPKNIIKLRQYLKRVAEGELPDAITLLNSEDDIKAIEGYLNRVLDEMRKKVRLLEEQLRLTREMKSAIESQQIELLEAERHRVMIQSVGAACHHIGQPATILRSHLYLLRTRISTPDEQAWVEECTKAVDSIAEVLEKLRRVSEYRTVPYRTFYADGVTGEDNAILDIEK